MASYLITGVAGFIGSALARELVTRGEHVRGLDNLSTGSLQNLTGIETAIEFLHADLRHGKLLEQACEGIDYIFHCAAIESVQQTIDDTAGTQSIHVDGTQTLIAAARAARVRRIVFSSSAAVYGNSADRPLTEDTPTNPQTPYAIQKLSCERHLIEAWETTGLETVILRLFNVFGPRQAASASYAGVIAQFIGNMMSTDQAGPIIYGDGEQARDFVYISDVVNASLLAMHAPQTAVAGRIFNIGSGTPKTVRIAFETIACMVGYTGEPRYVQARPYDVPFSVASIGAASHAFGYKPAISFANGLSKTITLARQRVAARVQKPVFERRRSERKLPGLSAAPDVPVVARANPADRHIDAHVFAEAVKNNELELFYQPILDLREQRVVGLEALLRWRSGGRLLTPAHFLHLAEQKGLTPILGAWVLETACTQLADLQKALKRPALRIAVNVSPLQLEQRSFPRTVDTALANAGLSHAMLDLELIERTLVRDSTNTQQNLFQLRRRGIRVAVDDFGTGYSNMNYLYRFPIDCIKIDQSFVQHKGHTRILQGIVAFARTLGVRTVAEGVETQFQLNHVTHSGCDEAQGFFIGRPVPAASVIPLIRDFEADLPQKIPTLSLPMSSAKYPESTMGELS
jgi:UDP-glucose 4-epimerase